MNTKELQKNVIEVAREISHIALDKTEKRNMPSISLPVMFMTALSISMQLEARDVLEDKGKDKFNFYVRSMDKALNEMVKEMNIELSKFVKEERLKGEAR